MILHRFVLSLVRVFVGAPRFLVLGSSHCEKARQTSGRLGNSIFPRLSLRRLTENKDKHFFKKEGTTSRSDMSADYDYILLGRKNWRPHAVREDIFAELPYPSEVEEIDRRAKNLVWYKFKSLELLNHTLHHPAAARLRLEIATDYSKKWKKYMVKAGLGLYKDPANTTTSHQVPAPSPAPLICSTSQQLKDAPATVLPPAYTDTTGHEPPKSYGCSTNQDVVTTSTPSTTFAEPTRSGPDVTFGIDDSTKLTHSSCEPPLAGRKRKMCTLDSHSSRELEGEEPGKGSSASHYVVSTSQVRVTPAPTPTQLLSRGEVLAKSGAPHLAPTPNKNIEAMSGTEVSCGFTEDPTVRVVEAAQFPQISPEVNTYAVTGTDPAPSAVATHGIIVGYWDGPLLHPPEPLIEEQE
ncbi:hypothetical protein Pelo_9188 [Pelomyxa schiedti]|nr:hypothetical protein Pelo_9188 [Pelomyxa schiedti]